MIIGEPKSKYIDKSLYLMKMTKASDVNEIFVQLIPFSIYSENDLIWRLTRGWVVL